MNNQVMKNASDESQVKAAKIKEKSIYEQQKNDLVFILSTDQGRRFMWRYLALCGVFKNSFTGSSETFFNEGKRLIGTTLLNEIVAADPDSYLKMMKQNNGEL